MTVIAVDAPSGIRSAVARAVKLANVGSAAEVEPVVDGPPQVDDVLLPALALGQRQFAAAPKIVDGVAVSPGVDFTNQFLP
jgi:hypothetical protein